MLNFITLIKTACLLGKFLLTLSVDKNNESLLLQQDSPQNWKFLFHILIFCDLV